MNYNDILIENEFPQPLKKEELFLCIKEANNGNLEARNKVINYNVRLVLKQVLKNFANGPYEKKELVSIGIIGLVKAVDTFDTTKNFEFSTYAIRCINNEILLFIRNGKKYLGEESLDQPLFFGKDGKESTVEDTLVDESVNFVEDVLKQELLLEVRRQVEMLESRDKKIIKMYFGFYGDKLYSQAEIANMMGVSRSYISKIIIHLVDTIRKNLEEQNLIEKVEKRKNKNMVRKIQPIYNCFK